MTISTYRLPQDLHVWYCSKLRAISSPPPKAYSHVDALTTCQHPRSRCVAESLARICHIAELVFEGD